MSESFSDFLHCRPKAGSVYPSSSTPVHISSRNKNKETRPRVILSICATARVQITLAITLIRCQLGKAQINCTDSSPIHLPGDGERASNPWRSAAAASQLEWIRLVHHRGAMETEMPVGTRNLSAQSCASRKSLETLAATQGISGRAAGSLATHRSRARGRSGGAGGPGGASP